MRIISLILAVLFAAGCLPPLPDYDSSVEQLNLPPADADGDGYDADEDCDDADASSYPGAEELCDGKDNNCDEHIDEGLVDTWYLDEDGDGYGDLNLTIQACDPSSDYVDNGEDCDDADGDTYPGAPERCDDVDNDCDEQIDEDLLELWYFDGDSDGYGDEDQTIESCNPDSGWVGNADDCDDYESAINPDADELCDQVDNDCDEQVDEDDAIDARIWYLDEDGDGYGVDESFLNACEQPEGYARFGGDCDDSDVAFNPAAVEDDCTDPNDYNCDGSTGYADADADGFAASEDCDDSDGLVNPDAIEICDEVDNDCDTFVDDDDDSVDASTGSIFYFDSDGDSYGDIDVADDACVAPTGFVADSSDCDDTDSTINPGATEVCDEGDIDEDCNGYAEDDDTGVDTSTQTSWYDDGDGDGYGNASSLVVACESPDSHAVTDDQDCDDSDSTINPDADEICDEVDNDCDGLVDDDDSDVDTSMGGVTYYLDFDADGYGDPDSSVVTCSIPSGYVADSTDCDDGDSAVNPSATDYEVTLWDEDCNGLSGREVSSYESDSGDFLFPSGENLVDDEDTYSVFVSGVAGWTDIYGSNATITDVAISTIYSGTLVGMEMFAGSSSAIEGGCLYATPVTILVPGEEYIVTVTLVHVGSMGAISFAFMSAQDYNNYLLGGSTYTIYSSVLVGEELVLGGVFTATSTSDVMRLCAKDGSFGHEYDLKVVHLSIDLAE